MNNELVSDAIVLIHFINFFHAFISFINQNKIWTIEYINDFSLQEVILRRSMLLEFIKWKKNVSIF
jgi:hypothetical protein